MFVQHLEDKHPHVHLTVRSLGYNGRRLNPRKADLQIWRERFAGELRLRGIEAEATPRRARGKVRKADHGAVLALRKRGISPLSIAVREMTSCAPPGTGSQGRVPGRRRFSRGRRRSVRPYLRFAEELEATGSLSDKALARQVREFVRDMPIIETRRHALRRERADFVKNCQRQRGAERKKDSGGHDKPRDGDREK